MALHAAGGNGPAAGGGGPTDPPEEFFNPSDLPAIAAAREASGLM